jgi:electron transfer flavoprotein alpha/beta subunit
MRANGCKGEEKAVEELLLGAIKRRHLFVEFAQKAAQLTQDHRLDQAVLAGETTIDGDAGQIGPARQQRLSRPR